MIWLLAHTLGYVQTDFEGIGVRYIFKVIEEVGDGFAFRVCKYIVVVYFRAACTFTVTLALMVVSADRGVRTQQINNSKENPDIPPQQ